jgi:hypothetical protein
MAGKRRGNDTADRTEGCVTLQVLAYSSAARNRNEAGGDMILTRKQDAEKLKKYLTFIPPSSSRGGNTFARRFDIASVPSCKLAQVFSD